MEKLLAVEIGKLRRELFAALFSMGGGGVKLRPATAASRV
jgi:hypothetical protein